MLPLNPYLNYILILMYLRKKLNTSFDSLVLYFPTLLGISLVCSYGTVELELMECCHFVYTYLLALMCTLFCTSRGGSYKPFLLLYN